MTQTLTIVLRELKLSCQIGLDKSERCVRQQILVDVDIILMHPPKDDTTPTLDYVGVTDCLRQLAASRNYHLLETFAQEATNVLLAQNEAQSIRLYCRKPTLFSDLKEAGVLIVKQKTNGLNI